MKKISSVLGILLGGIAAFAANPFTPGGVAVDWSQYDPKPQGVQSSVNLLKNGSFEMPGTDISGWRGKGHWVGWTHVHSAEKTPAMKDFQKTFSKSALRKISNAGAASGKVSAWIKTPDALKEAFKPLPMISNKISQSVRIAPETQEQLYRLVFMAKGFHTPTVPHTGSLVVMLQGLKYNEKKRFQNFGKGVQSTFTLRSQWTQHTVDLRLPAGSEGISVTLCLYGVGELFVDDVQLFPADTAKKKKERVQVRVSPYSQLDNTYCLGENLPGVINFTFNANNPKFPRKQQKLELILPSGFRVADVRDICKVSGGKDNVWYIDLMRMPRVAFTRSWYMLQACSVMIESTLPASEKTYPAKYRLVDGDWKGEQHTINLKVIPAFHGKRPKIFRSAAMLGHEFSFDGPGTAKIADFYVKSGFSAIHGARENLAKEIKKHGLLRYRTNYFLSNGFRLGAAPKTGNARFILADGKHFNRKICPIEVYKRGPYYMTEVYNKILKEAIVTADSTDIFMTNWEPYYLDSKGCFCNNCRDEFIKYSQNKLSQEEIMAVWPKDLLRKYPEQYFKFRSWQHGQLVITLHQDAEALGKTVGKESGFVPEISWRCTTIEGNSYCKQYNVKDYMYDLPWLEPWGPYIFQKTGEPYRYYPTAHLPTYGAAGMMKEFIAANFKNRKAPRMIAFPHGHQGENWVTEPEALAFEFLCFFVRGWEGAFGYYFPRGYDYRHWRAMAETNTAIAAYENFTLKGKNDNKGIKLSPVTPLPKKLYYAPAWAEPKGEKGKVPGLSKMGPIQFQAWNYNGEKLICAGNFWQKGEHFFKLQVSNLEPNKKYGVEVSGTGYGNFTSAELAKGILMQCGALRWQFIKIGKEVKVEFSAAQLEKLMAERMPAIKAAVAWEKAQYKRVSSNDAAENPEVDYKSIKSVTNAGVTVSAAVSSLAVKSAAYTLTVEPGQGGRIHDWKAGNELFIAKRRTFGFAVAGIWYPAKNALQLSSGMKLEGIVPVSDGVEVRLSRILTGKDKAALAGVRFDIIHKFTAQGVVSTTRITNLLHDAIELSFRYHNMPAILGNQKSNSGSIKFKSGEIFNRDLDQKLIRLSDNDPLLEQAFKIVKQTRVAKELPVTLCAPWNKNALQITFPAMPQSIVVWDNASQDCPSFEPIYKRTQIVPGKSAEFVMSATVVRNP